MKRNILTIFLASPGDLIEERKVVKDTVDRMNMVIGRSLGWNIELLGWEDTLPSFVRPQSIINKDVMACDIFIGILWKRWGQETGKFDSGFFEEFNIAKKQIKKIKKPEIVLFFKNIDAESLKDPGPQLKKVLDFKNEQIQLKELMFKEFLDVNEWSKLINDYLYSFIIRLQEKTSTDELRTGSFYLQKKGQKIDKKKSLNKTKKYPTETKKIFAKVASNLFKKDETHLDYLETARLFLQSSTWFSENCINITFGVHEINIAYKNRISWKLSFMEKWFLFKSFVNDKYNLCPGWYWFSKTSQSQIDQFICFLTEKGQDVIIREMAFLLLANTGYKASNEVIKKGLSDDNRDIVLTSIRLFKNCESIKNIHMLNQAINSNDSTIRNYALSTKIEMDYLKDSENAFNQLIKSGIEIPLLINETLEKLNLNIDESLLFKALKEGSPSIRKFASKYLRKSNLIKKENAYELLVDPDIEVQKEGIFALIDLREIDDIEKLKKNFPRKPSLVGTDTFDEEFIPRILRLKEPTELLSSIDFYSTLGLEAYRILADEHFAFIEPRIRKDLEDEFCLLKTESESKIKNKFGIEFAKLIVANWEQGTLDYIKSGYISASLNGLIKNGKAEDVKYARKYLQNSKSNSVIENSIKLISEFGDNSDVNVLIKIAENTSGKTQELAIGVSLKLSNDKDALLKNLFDKKLKPFTKIAAKYLSQITSNNKLIMAKQLLFSEEDDIRLIGLAIFILDKSLFTLEKLLDEYISNDKYYYNVVTYLDRCLYSPKRYREYFKNKLLKKLSE